MRRIAESIKNDDGNVYVEFLIGLILMLTLLATIISILSVFSIKNELDNANELLIQKAKLTGSTELSAEISSLQSKTGIDFAVSFDGTAYMPGSSHKVQLGDDIRITLSFVYNIGVTELVRIPLTVTSSFMGLSQRYHK